MHVLVTYGVVWLRHSNIEYKWCMLQAQYGKCGAAFMTSGPYCLSSCGRCNAQTLSTPSTPSAPSSASPSASSPPPSASASSPRSSSSPSSSPVQVAFSALLACAAQALSGVLYRHTILGSRFSVALSRCLPFSLHPRSTARLCGKAWCLCRSHCHDQANCLGQQLPCVRNRFE